ncbi:MAG: hypothetical protein ACI8Y4_002080 [Candidatus Poriferisodalaceae bacterium]
MTRRTVDLDVMAPASLITPIASDVLVNRRRGRYDIAVDGRCLLLRQYGIEESFELTDLSDIDASSSEGRVRLRFRAAGAQWTLRWYDTFESRTQHLLDLLETSLI